MQGFGFTSIRPGPKPDPFSNAGIAISLLSVQGSLSAAEPHTHSNSVHESWRKEYYSAIGIISFTVHSLVRSKRVARSGWNTGTEASTHRHRWHHPRPAVDLESA
ncbi:hypothetical protein MRX96_008903 [Rhipicephalus microplus]